MNDNSYIPELETFSIKNGQDFITVSFQEIFDFPNETCHWGGYDVYANVEIKSRGFYVKANYYTSTGELFNFYQELKNCNEKIAGTVKYVSYEAHLELTIEYDVTGRVSVNGTFSEHSQFENNLEFNFTTDQTFIRTTINELESIVDKYGDMKGLLRK